METKTPVMFLFVCNGTDITSILLDMKQMLELAYEDIEENRMTPEEFKDKEIPHFTLRVKVPRLPADNNKHNTNKGYNHY